MPSRELLTEQEVIELLEQYQVLLSNCHCVGTQGEVPGLGNHLTAYVRKDIIVTHPGLLRQIGFNMARLLESFGAEAVIAPPMGAINLGGVVAEELNVRFGYLEEKQGTLLLKRVPFIKAVDGKRVVLVEDVITSGKTTIAAKKAVELSGGQVVAVACVWNRRGTTKGFGVPLLPLVNRPLESWTLAQCLVNGPCARGIPINRYPGHGAALEELANSGKVLTTPPLTFI